MRSRLVVIRSVLFLLVYLGQTAVGWAANPEANHTPSEQPIIESGIVWAWGDNEYGSLGDGTTTSRPTPGPVIDLSDVIAVASGTKTSLAVKSDGTVWGWGWNFGDLLGDSRPDIVTAPVQIHGLSDVVNIAIKYHFALALKSDGSVWAWGFNSSGTLGDGTFANRSEPAPVHNISNVAAVACGTFHAVALKTDGTVWTWGDNDKGQLGDGTTTTRTTPVKVHALTGVRAVAAGTWHTLAITESGSVWAWGINGSGQLGNGDTSVEPRTSPGQVENISTVQGIAAGDNHSCGVKTDGTVWCWGLNNHGQLGDGTNNSKVLPTRVLDIGNGSTIRANGLSSMCIKHDGTLWAWGWNGHGNLGDGTTTDRSRPVRTVGLADIAVIADGAYVGLAVGAGQNTQPTANFSWTPPSPSVGEPVQFTDGSTGSPTSWSWNFGDAGSSTLKDPSHTYINAGTYAVTLTVSNAYGTDTTSRNLVIQPTGGGNPHLVPAKIPVGHSGPVLLFLRDSGIVFWTGAALVRGSARIPLTPELSAPADIQPAFTLEAGQVSVGTYDLEIVDNVGTQTFTGVFEVDAGHTGMSYEGPWTWVADASFISANLADGPAATSLARQVADLGFRDVLFHTGGSGLDIIGSRTGPLRILINEMHSNDVRVHAYCFDHSGPIGDPPSLISRAITAVSAISNWNSENPGADFDFDGVHLDVEGLDRSGKDTVAVLELYEAVSQIARAEGLLISAAVIPKQDPQPRWETSTDFYDLSLMVDVILPMSYVQDFGYNDWGGCYQPWRPEGFYCGSYEGMGRMLQYSEDWNEGVGVDPSTLVVMGVGAFDRAVHRKGNGDILTFNYPLGYFDSVYSRDMDVFEVETGGATTGVGQHADMEDSGILKTEHQVVNGSTFPFTYLDHNLGYTSLPLTGGARFHIHETIQYADAIDAVDGRFALWTYESGTFGTRSAELGVIGRESGTVNVGSTTTETFIVGTQNVLRFIFGEGGSQFASATAPLKASSGCTVSYVIKKPSGVVERTVHLSQGAHEDVVIDDPVTGHWKVEISTDCNVAQSYAITASSVPPSEPIVPSITEPLEYVYVIPASAHASGYEGTSWLTDVVVHNPGDEAAVANIYFLEKGHDNNATSGKQKIISPGEALQLADIVGNTFRETSSTGALFVTADQRVMISSRTYNNAAEGTFGQYVPGMTLEAALSRNDEARLIQLTQNGDYRTNLGFANTTGSPLLVTVNLYRSNGASITAESYTIPPYGYDQYSDIIGTNANDAYATVRSSTPGAKYFTYASVVDNESGDPVLVLPPTEAVPTGTAAYIPGVAHVSGTAGTNWRTDLEVHNPGSIRAQFILEFLKQDQPNTSPASRSFSLDPGKSVRYEDVVAGVFGLSGSGALRVTPSSGSVVVSGRSYNDVPGGTFGQFIGGVTSDDAISHGQTGRLIQLSRSSNNSSGFRTNVGFVNATGMTTSAKVQLYGRNGQSLGVKTYSLSPFEFKQVNDIFREVTATSVDNGFAAVTTTTTGGRFFAYASVVDNRSGDPVYIPTTVLGEASQAPPTAAPTLSVSGTTSSSVSLSWTSVTGATGYKLYRDSLFIYGGSNLGFTHSGLNPDTQYCYRVRAYNNAGDGPYSSQVCGTTSGGAPTSAPTLSVSGTTSSSVSLSWSSVSGATGYKLYRDSLFIYGGSNLGFTHSGLNPNTQYCYRVRAYNNAGDGPYSSQVCGTTSGGAPTSAPTLSVSGTTSSSVSLSWSSVSGATGYKLYRDSTLLYGGSNLGFTHGGLNPNTQYCYRVRAFNNAGDGPYSSQVCGTTSGGAPTSAPTLSVSGTTSSSVSLSWSSVSGATGYKLYRDSTLLYGGSNLGFTHSGLNPNTQYCYQVRAFNNAGDGPYSSQVCGTTSGGAPTSAPTLSVSGTTSSSVSLSWSSVSGATGYRLYRDSTLIYGGSNLGFTHSGLNSNTQYCYRVRAYNNAGEGPYSSQVCATTASGGGTIVFEDPCNNLNNWIPWGAPSGVLDTSTGNPAPSLKGNGDGSYGSGLSTAECFDISGGAVLEFDFMQMSNLRSGGAGFELNESHATSGSTSYLQPIVGVNGKQQEGGSSVNMRVDIRDSQGNLSSTPVDSNNYGDWVRVKIEILPGFSRANVYIDGILKVTSYDLYEQQCVWLAAFGHDSQFWYDNWSLTVGQN